MEFNDVRLSLLKEEWIDNDKFKSIGFEDLKIDLSEVELIDED